MQVLENISSKGCFYSKDYAPIAHRWLEPCGFLSGSVRSSFPEQGVTCHILLHSAEVRYSISARNLGAQPGVPSCPHPYGCGAPRLIHAIDVPLRTPRAHPLLQAG